ncbi:MAG: glycosyltransferase family 2 protein [Litoreibacter sp.]|nr:glycosyltransferase family 2 protein [Litoreibacter sp.]
MKVGSISRYFKQYSLTRKLVVWNRNRLAKRRASRHGTRLEAYDGKLAVVGIMKNEEMVISEWIEHYLSEGADEIIVIDNGSTDNSRERVEHWRETGRVKYVFNPKKYAQKECYWEAIQNHHILARFEWLLIADIDEFWYCKDGRRLNNIFSDYSDQDLVYVNWSIFGSSGLSEQPNSVRESFLFREPELSNHKATKWICRTSVLKSYGQLDIHKIKGICSSRTMSDNVNLQINHYATMSREYWQTA